MDEEIKLLLKLDKNPFFRLSEKDKEKLEEWKEQQVRVKPKRRTAKKKVVNVVEKEVGEIEEWKMES